MHHRLSGLSTYGLTQGDEHPAYALEGLGLSCRKHQILASMELSDSLAEKQVDEADNSNA